MRYTLRKSEIVRGKAEFYRVLSEGDKFEGTFLSCFVLPASRSANRQEPQIKAGFTLRRQFKKAVDRNRLKRIMREAYRLNKQILAEPMSQSSSSLSLVFLYAPRKRRETTLPPASTVADDMRLLLDLIARRGY